MEQRSGGGRKRGRLRSSPTPPHVAVPSQDSKWRKYAQAVDRLLQTFDAVNEWADVIKFLGALARLLATHTHYPDLPHKHVVSKRLAQCLNPALPSGVHSKALECYALVFANIGPGNILMDLGIYSYGLFAMLPYASMSVKPQWIQLMREHYVPLGAALKPCFKGFLLALLPGLEEEGNEYFNDILALIDALREAVGIIHFHDCLWLGMMLAPQHRLSAVHYLSKRFLPITSKADLVTAVGPDHTMLIRAFSAALVDDAVLVQRGLLEVLVVCLPLDRGVFEETAVCVLMRAVLGVVLRKDMSLNRRLYSWLLGPSESVDDQTHHLKTHALKPMAKAMHDMLHLQSSDIADLTRPYKILQALMDKAEIGEPLVDRVFSAIVTSLRAHEKRGVDEEDLVHTANMIVSQIDPAVVWTQLNWQLMGAMDAAVTAEAAVAALEHLVFFLRAMKLHDPDSVTVHFAFFSMIVARELATLAHQTPFRVTAVHHLFDIFQHCTAEAQVKTSSLPSSDTSPIATDATMELVAQLYASRTVTDFYAHDVYQDAAVIITQTYSALNARHLQAFLIGMLRESNGLERDQRVELFQRVGDMLPMFFWEGMVDEAQNLPEWLHCVLAQCDTSDFMTVKTALQLLIRLTASKSITTEQMFPAATVESIVARLWSFLDVHHLSIHLEAVSLIWRLHAALPPSGPIERIVAGYLVDANNSTCISAYEKFGTFWRLSDSVPNASTSFSRPLFLIIDLLRDADPAKKRAGETFLKCSIKSLGRLLDPMLVILVEPSIFRRMRNVTIADEQLPIVTYERTFNQAQVDYVLQTLSEVFKYGGPAFVKNLVGQKMVNESLLKLVRLMEAPVAASRFVNLDTSLNECSYFDIVIGMVTWFIFTEPAPDHAQIMHEHTALIQCHASDLLLFILSRVPDASVVRATTLASLQSSILQKVVYCIHFGRLDLQTKLLALFHCTLQLLGKVDDSTGRTQSLQQRILSQRIDGSVESMELSTETNLYATWRGEASHGTLLEPRKLASYPIFVRAICEGVMMSSNRALLPYFIDFILSSLPFMKSSFRIIVLPVIRVTREQLFLKCNTLERSYTGVDMNVSTDSQLDMEIILLLTGLEKIIAFCINDELLVNGATGARKGTDTVYGLRGITDLVTGVFAGGDSADDRGDEKLRELLFDQILESLRVVEHVWRVITRADAESKPREIIDHLQSTPKRIRHRLRRVVESFYELLPRETMEMLLELWVQANPFVTKGGEENAKFDDTAIDILLALKALNRPECFTAFIELLRDRTSVPLSGGSRPRKLASLRSGKLLGVQLILLMDHFAAVYMSVEDLIEVFPALLGFTKDFLLQAASFKNLFLVILRLHTTVLLKIPAAVLDDRRLRRDVYDTYQKLIDYAVLIAGRSFESGLWRRRDTTGTNPDSSQPLEGDPGASDAVKPAGVELLAVDSVPSANRGSGKFEAGQEILIRQMTQYLAKSLVPSLRKVIQEQDRIIAVVTNMVYYVVVPNIKARATIPYNRLLNLTLDLLREISRIPFAYRTWRKEVWDFFLEPRFFDMTPSNVKRWRAITQTIMTSERERIDDLLGRIVVTPSGLFTSREQETVNRSTMLRRLAFVVLCGEKDQFLPQLPVIQEKMVEQFKQGYNVAHAEVYLFLRVLITRISTSKLSSFWPVVLNELIQLCNVFIHTDPPFSPETVHVFICGCKFLDYLFLIAAEEFQIHQWIFLSDTRDALIRAVERISAAPSSFALLDQISNHLGASVSLADAMMPSTSGIVAADPNSRLSLELVARQDSSESIAAAHTDLSASGLDQYKRRPLLIVGQKLKTMADLVPFLQAVSRWTFESMMTTADHFHDPFPRANDGLFMGSTTTSTAMTTGGATAQLSALNVRTVDVPFIEDQLERDFALASDRGPHLTTGGLRVSTGGSGSSMNSAAIPASATTEDAAEHAMRLIDHQL